MKAMIEQTVISVALMIASGIAFLSLLIAAGTAFAGSMNTQANAGAAYSRIVAEPEVDNNSRGKTESADTSNAFLPA